MQQFLSSESGKSKTFTNLNISQIQHSPFNPRKNRQKESVEKLAERISKNGFEITRAIWVHPVNNHYEVFAGGTRYESAKIAKITEIPVILHDGFSEDEIVKLSEEDNENDEYHAVVNIVDVWMSYKSLADRGWSQERIAKAKVVSRSLAGFRLQLSDLSLSVKNEFAKNDLLKESHALELLSLLNFGNLSMWLTRDQVMFEILESVLKNKADKITAKIFAKEVEKYNSLIKAVQEKVDGLDGEYKNLYLLWLSEKKVRSISGAETEYSGILTRIESDIRERQTKILAEQKKITEEQRLLELEKIIQKKKDYIISRVVNEDFRIAMEKLEDNSVNLIFTDPPYDDESINLYGDLAEIASRKLKKGGSLITYAGHYALHRILDLMDGKLRYWWTIAMIYSGQSRKLEGKHVFVGWKPLLWFVKETLLIADGEYMQDIIRSEQPDKDLHEWQQDTAEAEYYIQHLTKEGDLVVDPFVGSGTTLISAYKLNRDFWGCELNIVHCETARGRILEHQIHP